jgi:maltose alpha-D-glucosyltransferase/alpha-amylase
MFSLPGTPVLFYGEEIGLGDNLAMDERESVRLPMQWADGPGAGFTTADERSLPRKLLKDGPFGYPQLNVRDQRRDPESFLNWMERVIRTRKEWPEFGWGEWQVLGTRNPAVLAHIATWDGSSVLAVHNFSDQPAKTTVQIPRDARAGTWQHIFGPGGAAAPEMRGDRFSCELPPYGYHWYGRREGV